ncbi:hypothetical protein ABB37_10041 [Leptomonas pyrrhocoris]|uniref:Uncharacterized protein n=1 Tax=Leptomonas pyrrhocoris TaxID=157538 RepID=A0A0M9FPG8_LEPPY|nr:hypothetical protein ABB37_10041 [Leptomonas pyrrhocoris]KPA73216.1 hypothetical protein ABB37_10041 [Leptomonas pyrrhocoris]|eukprot:XP_015651655.1 hypothetical protein ABB37_10041 [Leptomonas pyrrhocoris]
MPRATTSFFCEDRSSPAFSNNGDDEHRHTEQTAPQRSPSTPPLSCSSSSGGSFTPLSARRPPAAHRAGWRARLWDFLFPGEDTAGVEGAALHYGHGEASSLYPAPYRTEEAGATPADGPWSPYATTEPATGTVRDSMEPWHYMQVPLSRVILFLRLQQRLAEQWSQGWLYAPFFVMLTLFVFIEPGRGGSQAVVDFGAIRRGNLAQPRAASTTRAAILLEAFRLDTEAVTTPTETNTGGSFVPGNSERYAWMYSWYNETVNLWTPPPNRRVEVDEQLESIARTHHEPVFVNLKSVRTRRDVLRWLQLQCVPRLWNCRNPSFERQWRSTMTGAHYQLGAVRLVSRRYQQRAQGTKEVRAASKADLGTGLTPGAAPAPMVTPLRDAAVATPIIIDKRAAPPDIPRVICGPSNSSLSASSAPAFSFHNHVGGYVALLPFASSCSAVRGVLSVMETPKKDVLWPPAYNSSLEMREAWMDYTETDRDTDTAIADAATSCASFLFDPAVSEVLLQYVEYAARTNRYTVVEVQFAMSTGGAVVRPRLSTYSLSALRWDATFTPLALSICLALTGLFYGHCLLRRMLAQYAAKVSCLARPRCALSQRLWCALMVFLHTQNLVHLLALVLAAAAIGSWWHTLVLYTSVPALRYADRNAYPQRIDDVARHASVLLPRLCAGALFFGTIGLFRFACVAPGVWLCVQTVARCAPRLGVIFCAWLIVNVGMAMMCVMLYGSAVYEFRSFGYAYTMLVFALLDGGRSMMNSFTVGKQTGHYSILPQDDFLPGIRGSRLGRLEPMPLDYRATTLMVSNPSIYPVFLLFFYYFQSLVIIIWGTATIVESYRNVLLLPEAAELPLWRALWTLQLSSLPRALNAEFAKETIRRLLLSRDEAVMLKDMEYHLRLAYARAPAGSPAASTVSRHRGWHARESQDEDDAFFFQEGAHETAVSLTMVLWLLPRALQPEYGAAHLRRLWYLCVAAVQAAQRMEQPWKSAQWRQHWEQQPNSLSGWLHASLPEGNTIEEQAARVAMQLEELPNSVVRYVEGKFL